MTLDSSFGSSKDLNVLNEEELGTEGRGRGTLRSGDCSSSVAVTEDRGRERLRSGDSSSSLAVPEERGRGRLRSGDSSSSVAVTEERGRLRRSGDSSSSVAVQTEGTKNWDWRELLEILLGRSSTIAGCDCGLSFGQLRRFVKLHTGQHEEEEGVVGVEEEEGGESGALDTKHFLDRQSTVVVRTSGRRTGASHESGGLGSDGRDDNDDDREVDDGDGVIDWDQFGVPEGHAELRMSRSVTSAFSRGLSSVFLPCSSFSTSITYVIPSNAED